MNIFFNIILYKTNLKDSVMTSQTSNDLAITTLSYEKINDKLDNTKNTLDKAETDKIITETERIRVNTCKKADAARDKLSIIYSKLDEVCTRSIPIDNSDGEKTQAWILLDKYVESGDFIFHIQLENTNIKSDNTTKTLDESKNEKIITETKRIRVNACKKADAARDKLLIIYSKLDEVCTRAIPIDNSDGEKTQAWILLDKSVESGDFIFHIQLENI